MTIGMARQHHGRARSCFSGRGCFPWSREKQILALQADFFRMAALVGGFFRWRRIVVLWARSVRSVIVIFSFEAPGLPSISIHTLGDVAAATSENSRAGTQ
jgi:hypothetical protein